MGTPHGGSDYAGYARVMSRIVRSFTGTAKSNSLISELQSKVRVLDDSRYQFIAFLNARKGKDDEIKVSFFCEGRETKALGFSGMVSSYPRFGL
jgi:hypothetical protein